MGECKRVSEGNKKDAKVRDIRQESCSTYAQLASEVNMFPSSSASHYDYRRKEEGGRGEESRRS